MYRKYSEEDTNQDSADINQPARFAGHHISSLEPPTDAFNKEATCGDSPNINQFGSGDKTEQDLWNKEKFCKKDLLPYSYAAVIFKAFKEKNSECLSVKQIIDYVQKTYLTDCQIDWKKSLRCALSINECFIRVPRAKGQECSHWKLDKRFHEMFKDNGSFRRRPQNFARKCLNLEPDNYTKSNRERFAPYNREISNRTCSFENQLYVSDIIKTNQLPMEAAPYSQCVQPNNNLFDYSIKTSDDFLSKNSTPRLPVPSENKRNKLIGLQVNETPFSHPSSDNSKQAGFTGYQTMISNQSSHNLQTCSPSYQNELQEKIVFQFDQNQHKHFSSKVYPSQVNPYNFNPEKQLSQQYQNDSSFYHPPAIGNFHGTLNSPDKSFIIPDNYNSETNISQLASKDSLTLTTSSLKTSYSLLQLPYNNLVPNDRGFNHFYHQHQLNNSQSLRSNNNGISTPNFYPVVNRSLGHQDQNTQLVFTTPMDDVTVRSAKRLSLSETKTENLFDLQVDVFSHTTSDNKQTMASGYQRTREEQFNSDSYEIPDIRSSMEARNTDASTQNSNLITSRASSHQDQMNSTDWWDSDEDELFERWKSISSSELNDILNS